LQPTTTEGETNATTAQRAIRHRVERAFMAESSSKP
jgi:hypothetical protein